MFYVKSVHLASPMHTTHDVVFIHGLQQKKSLSLFSGRCQGNALLRYSQQVHGI